ncbi:LptF/LptG family permease [Roseivirga pacifica]|uniref:LptF/LptG family permease n=1 Tax=Roseivirga pacifica TaxID=1267423 RepID=UPI00227CC1BD|nr:LptF/LptG family permease [Roseivirga pacifica]
MKKIDKLVFGSFIGPFLLTLIVVDFILLLVTLIRYFDELFGKGLSFDIFAKLITYFSISSSPDAFPLAVLLSSIMTFGNLGEHSELTAIKSSGISLVRALVPIFVFVLFLTGVTYYTNTQLVPKVNLKTYSLLWDMRTKKPALDIKEGVFYDGIPGYSIKVNDKVTDEHLKDIIIYDHTNQNSQYNKKVTIADSGRMYSFMNQRYLALELFDGTRYEENVKETYQDRLDGGQFIRDNFKSSKMVFDLSSFDMGKTDEKLFRRSRLVQTRDQLYYGIDSMSRDLFDKRIQLFDMVTKTFKMTGLKDVEVPEYLIEGKSYYDSLRELRRVEVPAVAEDTARGEVLESKLEARMEDIAGGQIEGGRPKDYKGNIEIDSAKKVVGDKVAGLVEKKKRLNDPAFNLAKFRDYYDVGDTIITDRMRHVNAINYGVNNMRTAKNYITTRLRTIESIERDQRKFVITRNQQMSRSFACLIMFLIGAPIGSIIKKGGLGMPVIVSVIFFLIYYILNTTGDKWGKEDVMDPVIAVWMSNAILLPVGLFFLRQARNDARLFESDAYVTLIHRLRKFFEKRKTLKEAEVVN